MIEISGSQDASGMRFGIVAARFNETLVNALLAGAIETFTQRGANIKEIISVRVPGSFEIPVACKNLALSGMVDAIVALGVVIRGDTYHFELVADSATNGILNVGLETGIPVAHGLIAAESMEQAVERTGGRMGNKGSEAALAAIEMVHTLRALRGKTI